MKKLLLILIAITAFTTSSFGFENDWKALWWLENGVITTDKEVSIDGGLLINTIGSPTYDDLQTIINTYMSAGKFTGGGFTDNGDGSITVAAGTGMIKSTDSDTGTLYSFDWAEDTSVSLADNSVNFVFVDCSNRFYRGLFLFRR